MGWMGCGGECMPEGGRRRYKREEDGRRDGSDEGHVTCVAAVFVLSGSELTWKFILQSTMSFLYDIFRHDRHA